MKAIVTVVGKDQVGIIALVCTELAKRNVNVLDISQTVMQGYFTMSMVAELAEMNVPFDALTEQMNEVAATRGLSIRIQREDIFDAMYRI